MNLRELEEQRRHVIDEVTMISSVGHVDEFQQSALTVSGEPLRTSSSASRAFSGDQNARYVNRRGTAACAAKIREDCSGR